jgi:hypothetical protein
MQNRTGKTRNCSRVCSEYASLFEMAEHRLEDNIKRVLNE